MRSGMRSISASIWISDMIHPCLSFDATPSMPTTFCLLPGFRASISWKSGVSPLSPHYIIYKGRLKDMFRKEGRVDSSQHCCDALVYLFGTAGNINGFFAVSAKEGRDGNHIRLFRCDLLFDLIPVCAEPGVSFKKGEGCVPVLAIIGCQFRKGMVCN